MTIMVSGTGIAGMSAALAAANAGYQVTLYGPHASTPPAGGIQLAPNGWQALDQLGLFDAAIKRATQLDHILVRSGQWSYPDPTWPQQTLCQYRAC